MTDDTPFWRQIFDMLESPLSEKASTITNSAEFSKMLAYASQNWNAMTDKNKAAMAKIMHLYNMPSHSDMTKLARQIGALTGKVETLSAQIEDISEKLEILKAEPRSKGKP